MVKMMKQTLRQIQERYNVSRPTICRWTKKGYLKNIGRGEYEYSEDVIDKIQVYQRKEKIMLGRPLMTNKNLSKTIVDLLNRKPLQKIEQDWDKLSSDGQRFIKKKENEIDKSYKPSVRQREDGEILVEV